MIHCLVQGESEGREVSRSAAGRIAGSCLRVALLLQVSGCSLFRPVESFGIERAAAFSGDVLTRDGVVVAAVVSAEPGQLARESTPDKLASALQACLLEERPRMRVLPPASLERALGPETYRGFATSFQRTGEVQVEVLPGTLQQGMDSVRHLMVGVIESDVRMSQPEHPLRTTTMFFAVHDLQANATVWKGHFQVRNFALYASSIEGQARSIYDALLEALFEAGG